MKKRLGDPDKLFYQEPSKQNIIFTIKPISDSDPEIQSNFIINYKLIYINLKKSQVEPIESCDHPIQLSTMFLSSKTQKFDSEIVEIRDIERFSECGSLTQALNEAISNLLAIVPTSTSAERTFSQGRTQDFFAYRLRLNIIPKI